MDNSNKLTTATSGPVRTRRVSLPHNAKPYERKKPPPGSVNKKKQPNKEDEPEGLLAMLKTVITKPLGWIYRGSSPRSPPPQSQPTTTNNTNDQNSTGNAQETYSNSNSSGFNSTDTESQNSALPSSNNGKTPATSPHRKPPNQSLYAPKPVVLGSRKTLTLAPSILRPTHSPVQPKTDHEMMIERVAAIPTPIHLKQTTPLSADNMECDDGTPSVPINDFNARMSAFFQSKGNAPLTDEERQQILESVGQPSRFPPEAQTHLRRQHYMTTEIPNSSSYANQSPFVTRKRALPISPPSNALQYHMQYHQPSYPPSEILRPSASSSREYGGHVVESVPGSADRFGGASRMDVDRRYDLGERPGKRRDLRSNEERRRLQAMNEYAGTQDSFDAATAERIIQSLQRDNRTPLLDARRAPSSMYSRKGMTDTRSRRGQHEMHPMEDLPPSTPLATPIHQPSRSIRHTGPYTKDRRAVKQRAAALAAARKEADEEEAVPFFSASVSAAAATPVAVQPTPKKKTSATAAQMLAGIPTKGKGEDRLLKSISRTENRDMEVDSGSGSKRNPAREIAIAGEASLAFLTKPPSGLTGSASTTEPLFNFTNTAKSTATMTPTPLAAPLKPKQVDADAMDEGDDDGKKQQGFSKRISLKARPAPRVPTRKEKRGFSAEEDVEADEETIARETSLQEIPALPIGKSAFAVKPSEPGVFKVPGLPASAKDKPAESSAVAFTPVKFSTTTDSSAVTASAAPVTPAAFSTVSPSKTTSPFANLISTTPAGPPPTSLYTGPAPQCNFAKTSTSSGIDASTAVTGAKPDTAPPVTTSAPELGATAVASQPTTLSPISTTPFGTPTVSKTAPSMFGTTSSAPAPAPPMFSFGATSATAIPSKEATAPKENAGPPPILAFGKPTATSETDVSPATAETKAVTAEAKTAPSVTSEEPTPTPAPATFTFGTPVKPDAKTVAPSTPEDMSEMQMSPAVTPVSSKNGSAASGPPAISFNPPPSSSGFNFGSTTTNSTQPPASTAAFTAPVTTTAAPSGFTGFAFNTPAATTTLSSSGTGFAFGGIGSTASTGGSGATFGTPTSTATSGPPAIFSFGSTATTGAPVAKVTAPTFSFGSTPAATSLAPSTFTFGVPSAPTAASTGAPATTTPAPAFPFGAAAATSNAPATGFSFAGAAKKEEEAKESFSFGNGATTPTTTTGLPSTTAFSFGGTNATGSKTTFGGAASGFGSTPSTTGATTTFAFGQPANGVTPSPATGGGSGFTFGVPAATGSTGFSFGAPAANTTGNASGATAPSTGFSFGGSATGTTGSSAGAFQFPTSGMTTTPTGGFGTAPMPFSFGETTTPTPPQAAPPTTGGTSSFQFGTGASNGNPTGGFSFQPLQQQQQQQQGGIGATTNPAAPATGTPAFGFAFGTPQPSTAATAVPAQGGMTPFTFGAPNAAATGVSLFNVGSSSAGGKRGDGRPIARPRSKKRG